MRADRRRRAFGEFAAQAQHRLYRQAFLLAGEREAARDLVQSTLVKLYVAWPRVDHPTAYAQRTLMSLYLTGRERGRREQDLHRLAEPGRTPPHQGDPDAALSMLSALRRLPPRMRAVIVLRYWEDLSVDQAAAALGCSAGTVKSASSKGLAQLRDLLGDSMGDPPDDSLSDIDESITRATAATKEQPR